MLAQIVESDDGYEQFANFLEQEFSVENILFITEYVQLKNAMCEIGALKEALNALELSYPLSLPDSAPNSSISRVFTEQMKSTSDSDEQIINCAVYTATNELYSKYIDSSRALLEINISSGIRARLQNIFKSADDDAPGNAIEIIMPLLENATREIAYLINDSAFRFRQTANYLASLPEEA